MKNSTFHCSYSSHPEIPADISQMSSSALLQCFTLWKPMSQLSENIRKHSNRSFCYLPFDHTAEGEAMGGQIVWDTAAYGAHSGAHICTGLEEILQLPQMDLSSGRLNQILLACRELKNRGNNVCLEISGPFTILDILIDIKHVFIALKKNIALIETVMQKISNELIGYIKEAQKCGVDIISYADPSGAPDIIGPQTAKLMDDIFTCDFIKKAAAVLKKDSMLLLCPRITYELIDSGKIAFREHTLSAPMTYENACIEMLGKVKTAGSTCIKNVSVQGTSDTFNEILLI